MSLNRLWVQWKKHRIAEGVLGLGFGKSGYGEEDYGG